MVTACSRTRAGEPDAGPLLAEARRAWSRGDDLGAQAAQSLRAPDGVTGRAEELLAGQDAAYEAAESAFRAALKLDSQGPHAHAEFGRFLASRGRFAVARTHLEAALASPRSLNAFEPAERADVLRALGGVHERDGLTRAALEAYRQALGLDPSEPRTRLSLAVALCAWGEPEEALDCLKPLAGPAAEKLPSPAHQALAFYTLGYAREEAGAPEAALAAYRRAVELARAAGASDLSGVADQAPLAARRVARLLKELQAEPGAAEKLAQAAECCRKGVALKNEALQDRDAFIASRAELWSARTPEEQAAARLEGPQKKMLEASAAFQEALKLSPRFARAHRELGLLHLALVEPKAARKHLDAACLYDPLAPGLLAARGEVLLMLGEWEEALGAFEKLLAREPDFGPAHLGRARALAQLRRAPKDLDDALDALDRAQGLGVDVVALAPVRARLRDLLAALARGEKLVPYQKAQAAAPAAKGSAAEPFEPWKIFQDK